MFKMLIGFLPWLLYFTFSDPEHALMGSILALGAQLLLGLDGLRKKRILDWVTLLYFGALVPAFYFGDAELVGRQVFVLSGFALTLTAFGSILAGVPFTLEYARESVEPEHHDSPLFIKVNWILSGVWGGNFAVQTLLSVLYLEQIGSASLMNEVLPNALTLCTITFSSRFPDWYVAREMNRGGVANLEGISPLRVVSFKGGSAAYRTLGRGAPLVLLNGSHMTLHNWDPELLEGLAHASTLYLLDYPGIGESSYPVPDRIESLCEWLQGALSSLKLESFDLLGYSMGGWLAQEYTFRFPHRVKHLVLLASDPGGESALPGVEKDLQALSDTTGTERERAIRLMGLMFPAAILEQVGPKLQRIFLSASLQPELTNEVIEWEDRLSVAWYRTGPTQRIANMEIPVLVCGAELDRIVPYQNSTLLQESFPQARLVAFPKAGHGLVYQEAETLIREITTLLAGEPSQSLTSSYSRG